MIKIFMLLICFVSFIFITPFIIDDPGYVYLSFINYSVQSTFVSFVILSILVLLVFCLVCKIFSLLFSKIFSYKIFFKIKNKEKATKNVFNQVTSIINNDIDKSHEFFDKLTDFNLSFTASFLLDFLFYAKKLNLEESEKYLDDYSNKFNLPHSSYIILKIWNLYNHNNFEQAYLLCKDCLLKNKSPAITGLFYKSCISSIHYDDIIKNRKLFIRYNLLNDDDYFKYIIKPIQNTILEISDVSVLKSFCNELQNDIRHSDYVLVAIANQYNKLGEFRIAEKLIAKIKSKISKDISYIKYLGIWTSYSLTLYDFFEKLLLEDISKIEKIKIIRILVTMDYLSQKTIQSKHLEFLADKESLHLLSNEDLIDLAFFANSCNEIGLSNRFLSFMKVNRIE
ncbi:MAG: hypothetical protein ACI4V7_02720 [Succinivibrionaceae bacterium]